MATRKAARRGTAPRRKGRRVTARNRALKDSLEGLRDALDLTLTRVIEDDMDVDEARAVLRYLEKELDSFEPRTRPQGATRRGPRRSRNAARRRGPTGER